MRSIKNNSSYLASLSGCFAVSCLLALAVIFASAGAVDAQVVKYAVGVADDLVKLFISSGAKVGKSTINIVENHVVVYGDDFVRAARNVGFEAVEIAYKHSGAGLRMLNSQGRNAVVALKNYGDVAVKACTMHGDEMASVMAKTRKLPASALTSQGKDLLRIKNAIPCGGIEITAEAAAQGAGRNAGKVISAMGQHGKKILDYIQNNPVIFGEMLIGYAVYKVVNDDELFNAAIGGAVAVAGKGIEKAGDVAVDSLSGGGSVSSSIKAVGIVLILLLITLALLSKLGVNFRQIYEMFAGAGSQESKSNRK